MTTLFGVKPYYSILHQNGNESEEESGPLVAWKLTRKMAPKYLAIWKPDVSNL